MLKMVDKEEESVKHIADIVGEWGEWQISIHLFWYCFLLSAVSALNNMGYSFHSNNVDFWCIDVSVDYSVFAILVQIFAKNFIFQIFSLIMFFQLILDFLNSYQKLKLNFWKISKIKPFRKKSF